jgi:hypothetical protein
LNGLVSSQRIVDSPPDSLATGDVVRVAAGHAETKGADLKAQGN